MANTWHAGIRFIEQVCHYQGNDCVMWPFSKCGSGYGKVHINGKREMVHRVVCKIIYGPAPTSKHWVAHSCGKGQLGCITPKHLRWATPKENHADKIIHGTMNYGERNGAARLTPNKVQAIRQAKGSQRLIAARFGVCQQTVSDIKLKRRWAWL